MEQFDPAAPNNILERTESGKFRVRNDMQLILYTSFAPPLQNCKLGTEKPSLPLFGSVFISSLSVSKCDILIYCSPMARAYKRGQFKKLRPIGSV